MQNVNCLWEPHGIDGPERISPEVGNNLQHPGAIPFRGFAFSGILPLWTRSNAKPIWSLTSSGSSRKTFSESPMKRSGLIEVAVMFRFKNMLVLA